MNQLVPGAGGQNARGDSARQPRRPFSRRDLLLASAALGGLLDAIKQPARAANSTSTSRFIVNRLTYGWNQQEQLLADQLGYYGYLDYHLDYTAIDDSVLNQRLQQYIYLTYAPGMLINYPQKHYLVHELTEASFLRATFSKRQLYQRMVEFWTDHFNIDINNTLNPWLKIVDDRDVIRPNVMGKFGSILLASAKSPSMSMYLNNDISVAGNQNENYARELMELHTMGVDGGYTQQDVVEVARCFTGWQYHGTDEGADAMTFAFFDYKHDQGPKTVLGHSIPANGGMNDGLMVLDILVNHPSTAKFIAKKLCKFFYSYNPPQSLIDSVAATYTATGGVIGNCIRTIFSSVDPATAPLKLKRPYHFIVSAFRAIGADIVNNPYGYTSQLRDQMALSGHPPFNWMTPDGYPDKLDYWANMLLPRWNFATLMGSYDFNAVTFDTTAFFTSAVDSDGHYDPNLVVNAINQSIFGGTMPFNDQLQIKGYVSNDVSLARLKEAVGLALASPSFQWF